MDMKLSRYSKTDSGIFGKVAEFFSLEHAYRIDPFKWSPKIPTGTYTCVRGFHKLEGMDHQFETFEITNVPGHTGCLFHTGDWNEDSNGCVILGMQVGELLGRPAVIRSHIAFNKFMDQQKGLSQFKLEITD